MLSSYADMGKQSYASITQVKTLYHCIVWYIHYSTCMHVCTHTHIISRERTVCIMYDRIMPGQQIQKPRSFRAILVRTLTSQSCYSSYRYPYTLVFM